MAEFNWLDIFILILILIFALKGLKSGIIRELFGTIGIIGGFIVAIRYKSEAGSWISKNVYDLNQINIMSGDGLETIVGFVATIFGIWILALILGEILSKLLELSGLGILDKLGGVIFGGTKIFLIFSILVTFIHSAVFLNSQIKPYFEKSITYPYLLKTGNYLMNFEKEKISLEISNKIDENKTNIVYEKSEEDADSNNSLMQIEQEAQDTNNLIKNEGDQNESKN